MKRMLATAIVSLGVVLAPAAFAHNAEPPSQATQMQQPTNPQLASPQRPDDTGYGMGSSGTSNASVAQTSRHAALMSHEGRNDLFAHH